MKFNYVEGEFETNMDNAFDNLKDDIDTINESINYIHANKTNQIKLSTFDKVVLGLTAVAGVACVYRAATGSGTEVWEGIKKGAAEGALIGGTVGLIGGGVAVYRADKVDKVFSKAFGTKPTLTTGEKITCVLAAGASGAFGFALTSGLVGGAFGGIGVDPDFAGNNIEFTNTVGG